MSLLPSSLRRLLEEFSSLQQHPPEGVRLAKETFGDGEGDGDMRDVQAWVEGPPGTPFEGGYFKLRFGFGPDYPTSPPKCTFITKIWHPNVNEKTGEICVSTLKKDWTPDVGVSHILLVIKCLLIHPGPDSALNAEAGQQLLEAFDDYASRARLWTSIHATPRAGAPIEFAPAPSTSAVPTKPPSDAPAVTSPALPLLPSTFSNTSSASPGTGTGDVTSSGGKKRTVSVSIEGEAEKGAGKKVGGAKKKTLKRL